MIFFEIYGKEATMDLLIVIDMIDGFVNHGALADKNINRIVDNISCEIEKFISKGQDIIAFKDTHDPHDIEFENYPPHCIKGTDECELVPQLKKYSDKMMIIEKNTTNGFVTHEFGKYIASKKLDTIVVTGCCTDICVYNFVESLTKYLKSNKLATRVVVYKNMVDTFGGDNHLADEINREYLQKMSKLGVEIR